MPLTLAIEGLDKLTQPMTTTEVIAGVRCSGPAMAYALVWEFGRVGIKPGPKTVLSTNYEGEEVVLTIQAPHGYIRIHQEDYKQIMADEFSKADWANTPMNRWDALLRDVVNNAAARCAELIIEGAPVDSGDLVMSIEPVEVGDSILGSEQPGALDIGAL